MKKDEIIYIYNSIIKTIQNKINSNKKVKTKSKMKKKRIDGEWNKKINLINQFNLLKKIIKKTRIKSQEKLNLRVVVKCCKGWHENQGRKRKDGEKKKKANHCQIARN